MPLTHPANAPAFAPHDHKRCAQKTMAAAKDMAAKHGLRLTPVRQRVLELLLEEHRSHGAYEILERLAAEGFGHQPPVAYRALDFLVEAGFAHRVRRLNAFIACMHPGEDHAPAFFICDGCQSVAEAPEAAVVAALGVAAAEIGFAVTRANIEAVGLCPSCQVRENG